MTPIPLGILDFPTGGGGYDWLETVELTSVKAGSVSFSNLVSNYGGSYASLRVVGLAKSDNGGSYYWHVWANNDNTTSRTNHRYNLLTGNQQVQSFNSNVYQAHFTMPASANANNRAPIVVDFAAWDKTDRLQRVKFLSGQYDTYKVHGFFQGQMPSTTSAVDVITLAPSAGQFELNSRFSLYGLRKG